MPKTHADSEFIRTAEAAALSLNERGCLEGYAAEAAAKVLIENWRDAMRDSNGTYDRISLVGDAERTIAMLRQFASKLDTSWDD